MKKRRLKRNCFQTDAPEQEETNLQTYAPMVEDKILQTDEVKFFLEEIINKETHSVGIQCDLCGETFVKRRNVNIYQQKKHKDAYEKMKIIERELETKLNLQ